MHHVTHSNPCFPSKAQLISVAAAALLPPVVAPQQWVGTTEGTGCTGDVDGALRGVVCRSVCGRVVTWDSPQHHSADIHSGTTVALPAPGGPGGGSAQPHFSLPCGLARGAIPPYTTTTWRND